MAGVVCVSVCMHMWCCACVCVPGFSLGPCTNPFCMSLILDDVQAVGNVCDGENACMPS